MFLFLTVFLDCHEDPERECDGEAGSAGDVLPLAGRGLHLGERDAEGSAVELLLLLDRQLLPVALLLLAESLKERRNRIKWNSQVSS